MKSRTKSKPLPEVISRFISAWATKPCWANPCVILANALDSYGYSSYRAACDQTFAALRARFGMAEGVPVKIIIGSGLEFSIAPAEENSISDGECKHPISEEKWQAKKK